jgi:hypothetical protein
MSSPIVNMIKEDVNDILLAQAQVQRRSSENVVLVDHRLCVRPGQLVCMGVVLPVAIGMKAARRKAGFWRGGITRQRSETSANLRLAFTTERFLSRKSCVGVYEADKGIPMLTASLCLAVLKGDFQDSFCGWVVLTIERREGEGDGGER